MAERLGQQGNTDSTVAWDSHHSLTSMERLRYCNNQYSLPSACLGEVRPPVAKGDITMSCSLGRVLRGRKWKNRPRYIHGKTNELNVRLGVFEMLTPCFFRSDQETTKCFC